MEIVSYPSGTAFFRDIELLCLPSFTLLFIDLKMSGRQLLASHRPPAPVLPVGAAGATMARGGASKERRPDHSEVRVYTIGLDPLILRNEAAKCLRLARIVSTAEEVSLLNKLASEYETLASEAETGRFPPAQAFLPTAHSGAAAEGCVSRARTGWAGERGLSVVA